MANRLEPIGLDKIQIHDSFWNRYIDLVEREILPFQWELINDRVEGAEKSYCIRNFRIAAGREKGEHQGMVFQDTDLAKWLEAVGYSLKRHPDPKLEQTADEAIDLIAEAQCKDGYLNTYYTITGTPRWSDLFEGHELYTAGHMIEAAVAYYEATGKEKFLQVVCRFADYLCRVFGNGEQQIHGYPGHPEVELALVRLFRVTGSRNYLELARYFIMERGKSPSYFDEERKRDGHTWIFPEFVDFDLDYAQAHAPVLEQETAEGHAVRAVYLYSAMADLADAYQDGQLMKCCEQLWENITQKKMYLTGSIGSAAPGERFTGNYDLPNDTNYSETCAAIGLAMFSNRMFRYTRDGKYMDTVETALYNTVLAGTALDGHHFFYVNPLEVVPDLAEHNPTMSHVKTVRQQWFGVACCPPNIARTLASMGNYMYDRMEDTIFSNLFISSEAEMEIEGETVKLSLQADYPDSGRLIYQIGCRDGLRFTLAVRQPGFSEQLTARLNGAPVRMELEKGYRYLEREWKDGDQLEIELDVSFRFVYCNPLVPYNVGKTALMRGPWVYCLEEADNGKQLASLFADPGAPVREEYDSTLLGGILCGIFEGYRMTRRQDGTLYSTVPPEFRKTEIRAVPYCVWNNRGRGEMLVWMHVK